MATTRTPEQIRADIERTRERLGETVEALADKADVKTHAKEKVDEVKTNVTETARSNAVPAAVAVVALVAVVVLLKRRG